MSPPHQSSCFPDQQKSNRSLERWHEVLAARAACTTLSVCVSGPKNQSPTSRPAALSPCFLRLLFLASPVPRVLASPSAKSLGQTPRVRTGAKAGLGRAGHRGWKVGGEWGLPLEKSWPETSWLEAARTECDARGGWGGILGSKKLRREDPWHLQEAQLIQGSQAWREKERDPRLCFGIPRR